MRTIGFVLLILGGLTIYLAWKGKIGAAFNAIFNKASQPSQKSTKTYKPNPSASQVLPGYSGSWHM